MIDFEVDKKFAVVDILSGVKNLGFASSFL